MIRTENFLEKEREEEKSRSEFGLSEGVGEIMWAKAGSPIKSPTWLAAGLWGILLRILASVLGRGGLLLLTAQHLVLVLRGISILVGSLQSVHFILVSSFQAMK